MHNSMLTILQQPYVFAAAIAILTATVMYFYSRTIESDEKANKTFYKTLAVGLAVGMGLAYLSRPKAEALSTEPFMEAAPAAV